MKSHVWDYALGHAPRKEPKGASRGKKVAQILKAAYRKHVHDRFTKQAVKRCLR